MTDRILEIEHHPGEGVTLRFKAPSLSLMPEATRSHCRAARKEMLLALRSLLDWAIEQTEAAEKAKTKKTKVSTKIEVQ